MGLSIIACGPPSNVRYFPVPLLLLFMSSVATAALLHRIGLEPSNKAAPPLPVVQLSSGGDFESLRPEFKSMCETCMICLQDFQGPDEVVYTPCKHVFHSECAKAW